MSTDWNNQEPAGKRADLWRLPEVEAVEAKLVRYEPPVERYEGPGQVRKYHEAVEILVRTSGELPVRALSPALYVGDVAIREYEPAGRHLYRFFAFEPEALPPGAPISLGWPDHPVPRRETKFRLQVPEVTA